MDVQEVEITTDEHYEKYLASLWPETSWKLEANPLSSEPTTRRATNMRANGLWQPSSVIVKRVWPHFDSNGTMCMDTVRQQSAEETMLRMFESTDQLHEPDKSLWNSILVPSIIKRSQDLQIPMLGAEGVTGVSVLVLRDLGYLMNLDSAIISWVEAWHEASPSSKVAKVASSLGGFLASLHSPNTLNRIAQRKRHMPASALYDDHREGSRNLSISQLSEFLETDPRCQLYVQRLRLDLCKLAPVERRTVVHGRFNSQNILFKLPCVAYDDRPILVGWKMATKFGRGVNGEVPEFLGPLHCKLIGARRRSRALYGVLKVFCQNFTKEYRERAKLECTMKPNDRNTKLFRSALLRSRRSIIAFANDECSDSPEYAEMMDVGIWYLHHACETMNDFVEVQNQQQLEDEDEGLIRSIFIVPGP